MKNAAILGAGSLGTIMGACVSQNGGSCTLIDTNREHVDALNANGATVTGFLDIKKAPVKAITPDQMEGVYDLVIVLTKQLSNKAALGHLLGFIDENSVVCTLQNGVPEESVAAIVGRERTCGGAVGWGATWVKSGVSSLNTKPEFMIYEIGNLENVIDYRVKRAEEFLNLAGKVTINTNLLGFRWAKLLMNSALSGMSAATGMTFGEVIDDDTAVTCAVYVANELMAVAEALGITLENIVPGKNFEELRFSGGGGRQSGIAFLRDVYEAHRPSKASMLQDMEKGIACEIDYINGVVCENGRKTGIATPFNDTVAEIVKGFEAGTLPFPSVENLAKFPI